MAYISSSDVTRSVATALQYISYYHPSDFIQAMHEAYLREQSPAARDAIAQILINSRMCATGHRPICQDTGIVTVFVKVGMGVRWENPVIDLDDLINEGVRQAYALPENVLRASIVSDPAGARSNTKDNTPAIIHYALVPGSELSFDVAAKGGWVREQGQDGHAQPFRLHCGMGVKDSAHNGCRVVPSRNAWHWYWRYR